MTRILLIALFLTCNCCIAFSPLRFNEYQLDSVTYYFSGKPLYLNIKSAHIYFVNEATDKHDSLYIVCNNQPG